MCLILKHTSLAQYGMSHLAKGMVVPVIGSLVVAFSLLCMAKEFTCLLAFQCGDCFLIALAVYAAQLRLSESNDACINCRA